MSKLYVRNWRRYRGYTQAQLAQRSGVSRVTIANTEIGASVPSEETQKQIAKGLGIAAEALLFDPFDQIESRLKALREKREAKSNA